MAAQLYDEILFDGATFADLEARQRPVDHGDDHRPVQRLARSASCSRSSTSSARDLMAGPLSRAAATSSAVPLVLSPVTLNNYGGTCGFKFPGLAGRRRRPGQSGAARGARDQAHRGDCSRSRTARTGRTCTWSTAASPTTSACARCWRCWRSSRRLRMRGVKTPLDNVKRIVVVVVNSLSVPEDQLGPVGAPARHVSRSCSRRPACRSTAIRPRPSS